MDDESMNIGGKIVTVEDLKHALDNYVTVPDDSEKSVITVKNNGTSSDYFIGQDYTCINLAQNNAVYNSMKLSKTETSFMRPIVMNKSNGSNKFTSINSSHATSFYTPSVGGFVIEADTNGIETNTFTLGTDSTTLGYPLTVSSGGTGATSAIEARENLGLGPLADFKPEYIKVGPSAAQSISQTYTNMNTNNVLDKLTKTNYLNAAVNNSSNTILIQQSGLYLISCCLVGESFTKGDTFVGFLDSPANTNFSLPNIKLAFASTTTSDLGRLSLFSIAQLEANRVVAAKFNNQTASRGQLTTDSWLAAIRLAPSYTF